MHQICQARGWDQLRCNTKLRESLNPLRGWLESVCQANEKKQEELNLKNGIMRPQSKLTFLVGDPTKYPSFETPYEYRMIASKNVDWQDTSGDSKGEMNVREQLAERFSKQNFKLNADDIFLCNGGSPTLFYCIYSMCNKGDKILMARPTFPLMIAFSKFLDVDILCNLRFDLDEKNWQPDFDQIEAHLRDNENVRFILLNSPNNPLGSILTEDSIQQIIKICEQNNNLPIVADEIYEFMTFNKGEFKFLAEYSKNVPVISCSGLTKRCLVPGWRLGWIVFHGQPGVFDQVKKALSNLSNIFQAPNIIAQHSAIQVYDRSTERLENMMDRIQTRYNLLKRKLENIPGIKLGVSSGGMFGNILVNIEKFNGFKNTIDFATLLQIEENLLIFPGQIFNGGNFLRFVICADEKSIEEACERLRRFSLRHSLVERQ